MESGLFNKQRTIQTIDHILWTVQLTRNVPKNDEQHIQRVADISKLHR